MVVLARSRQNYGPLTAAGNSRQRNATEDNSPRASLEALSRLHQELVEQEARRRKPLESTAEEQPAEDAHRGSRATGSGPSRGR